jgi:transcriptional regulator with XRE-family HTH domain
MKRIGRLGIGKRLCELRESLDVFQNALGEAIGMKAGLISQYERETVSPSAHSPLPAEPDEPTHPG